MVGEGSHEPHNPHRLIQQHPIFNTQDYLDFAERQRLEGVEVESLLAEPSSALRAHAPAIAAGYKSLGDRQEASVAHLVARLDKMELLLHRLAQAQRTQSESQQATIQAMHLAQQNAWRDQQKAWTDWMQAMIAGAAALRPSAPPPLPAMPPPPPPASVSSLPPLSAVQSGLGPRQSAAAGPSTPIVRASTAAPHAGPSSAPSGSMPRRRERSDSEESDGNGNEHGGGDTSVRSDKPPRKRKAPENTTPMHSLNPTVTTVQQAWDEYWNGYAGAPSLRSLEMKHGTAWCGGHGHAMRKAFKRRLRILARIEAVPEHERPAKIAQMQAVMGTRSLDWLAKDPTALLSL